MEKNAAADEPCLKALLRLCSGAHLQHPAVSLMHSCLCLYAYVCYMFAGAAAALYSFC